MGFHAGIVCLVKGHIKGHICLKLDIHGEKGNGLRDIYYWGTSKQLMQRTCRNGWGESSRREIGENGEFDRLYIAVKKGVCEKILKQFESEIWGREKRGIHGNVA